MTICRPKFGIPTATLGPNEHAAETIGKSRQTRSTSGKSFGADSFNVSAGKNESFYYDVPPHAFTKLRNGGKLKNGIVDAIFFKSGRAWPTIKYTYSHTLKIINNS